MQSIFDSFPLRNGVKVPCVGFGTWQLEKKHIPAAVSAALDAGYRHFDGAAAYGNEEAVGAALSAGGVPRSELFVTSKVWNTDRGYNEAIAACKASLRRLGMDYLDLYLIHWPFPAKLDPDWREKNRETWGALEALYRDGLVRAIGMSNFLPHHLQPLIEEAEVLPMVDQVELHPGQRQTETLEFCRANGVLAEAWGPLGHQKLVRNDDLRAIGERYGKTAAQVCIRWCIQLGVVPLPKSRRPARILQNADVFDFALSDDDMKKIDSLPYLGGSGLDPDTACFS
jgi:diketogulonate reductase-like aldo/keto reductase